MRLGFCAAATRCSGANALPFCPCMQVWCICRQALMIEFHGASALMPCCAAPCRAVPRRAALCVCSQGKRQLASIAEHMEEMWEAEEEAARHAAFVHAVPWMERAAGGHASMRGSFLATARCLPECCPGGAAWETSHNLTVVLRSAAAAAGGMLPALPPAPCRAPPAGMFEPPPPDRFAVATLAGLVLNSLSTLLFMANYTALLPPTDALCVRIGVPSSYTGYAPMAARPLAQPLACWHYWHCRLHIAASALET